MKLKSIRSKAAVPVEKTFCTTREAGDLLGVSAGTVQLWVDNGLLMAWKTAGGHRRIVLDSVRQMLQKTPVSVPSGEAPAHFVAALRPLQIVVVDDDPHMLGLYQRHMAHWPMVPDITYIDNAVAALLSIGRSCPDLLVTDLHMPGMDGFNMLRVLRDAPAMAHTTIVVASGLDAEEISRRGGIPQGVELLTKPVPFERLLEIASGIHLQGRLAQT